MIDILNIYYYSERSKKASGPIIEFPQISTFRFIFYLM